MKIFIKAKPNSKKTGVEEIDPTHFIVRVKEPPKDGKANRAIEKAVAEHLNIPYMQVWIVSGTSSHDKIIEIK